MNNAAMIRVTAVVIIAMAIFGVLFTGAFLFDLLRAVL